MRVHHINCGTLCPGPAWLVDGKGSLFARTRMVCHCLVVETNDGLVLVDTGLGLRDIADPGRLGKRFVTRNAPRLDPSETAAAQVERLGFRREDVRHLVPTHLDVDHAGGLSDFPDAAVHVLGDEHDAVFGPAPDHQRTGYRPAHWEHGPRWKRHEVAGERWFGFDAVRALPGVDAEVLLVPLVGHTRGHCGVAVKTAGGWLLHAGDAYFSHLEIDPVAPRCPPGIALFQWRNSADNVARRANQERLRALARDHAGEVRVFSAHSATEYDRLAVPRASS